MPVVPFIPAIIGAAGSIGGGLLSGRKSKEEKQALGAESELAKTQTEAAQFGLESAKGLLPQAEGTLNEALGYYSRLLGGDRQAMLEAVGPEVNTILSQYDTAKRAISEFGPRGGGRTATLAELPFKYSGLITRLLQGVRPAAAAGVERIGGTEASLVSSLLPRSTGAASTLLQNALLKREQNIGLGESIGGSLGSLLYQILMGGGTTGTTGTVGGIPVGSDIPIAG